MDISVPLLLLMEAGMLKNTLASSSGCLHRRLPTCLLLLSTQFHRPVRLPGDSAIP